MNKTVKPRKQDVGSRLDASLAARYPQHSRSYWEKAIESGYVNINDATTKASFKLTPNDKITIKIPKNRVKKVKIPVIYQDENVVVIDKPAGVLSHSKGAFNPEFTVADFMDKYFVGKDKRNGIVHRLDRTTSGVMICARNDDSLAFLQKQFSQRKVKKQYSAVIGGVPNDKEAILELPIERNPKAPSTFRVGPNGKSSTTKFEVDRIDGQKTLVTLTPETGRTHQLRVHMAFMGWPIVGDTLYGGEPAERVMLHASSLELNLPGGKRQVFESKAPESF